jgi:hypothetical protein
MKAFRQSIVLLLLMLVTLPSLGLSMHMCGGKLNNITLLSLGHTCEMEMEEEVPLCHALEKSDTNPACCQDQVIATDDQELISQMTGFKISKPDLKFIASFFSVVFKLLALTQVALPDYQNYSPPLLERDIFVLVQSFLL